MHLLSLTLLRPTAVTAVAYGSFSAPRQHELAVLRGTVLELLRPEAETQRLLTVSSTDAFGLLRCAQPLRLLGQATDHLVVTSDAGTLTVLAFRAGSWVSVFADAFGKTGVRRLVPGQFLAREPHGRAIMVAALEKQKFAYVVSRTEATNALAVSSPLEAHRQRALVFDLVALDNGFDNPLFACLELDYGDADGEAAFAPAAAPKMLTYYELDLGLNHVVRKWARETDRGANLLVPVPGEAEGPGGCLVLCENWVLYEHNAPLAPGALPPAAVRTAIPRRTDMPESRGLLLVAWTVHKSKAGGVFFLVQSELGDLYKVTLVLAPAAAGAVAAVRRPVVDVVVKYFDTVPAANALCITRSGLLFCASEFGNHVLWQFQSLGDDGDEAAEAHAIATAPSSSSSSSGDIEVDVPSFAPRALRNLAKVDEALSLAPVTDMRVLVPSAFGLGLGLGLGLGAAGAASAGVPQILALCGRGPRSTLRVLRQGLNVTELACSPMPGAPIAVFTIKAPGAFAAANAAAAAGRAAAAAGASVGTAASAAAVAAAAAFTAAAAASAAGQPDRYIVLSFSNATVTLAVGDTVEEVPAADLGFFAQSPTLAVALLADGSYLQVYPAAMRIVTFVAATGAKGPVREWHPPGRRTIVRAALNSRQVLLALSGGEVVYFEYDAASRGLKEAGKKSLGAEVTALALAPVPEGRLRNPFCALADSSNMVRVLSLDPERLLEQASSQALRAGAESLAIVAVRVHGPAAGPHLFIGLQNGVLSRLTMDEKSGVLSDPRVRFLGLRPVRLAAVRVAGAPALLALSSRAFVAYNLHGRFHMQPLTLDSAAGAEGAGAGFSSGGGGGGGGVVLEHASAFSTGAMPEALVALSGSSLRILVLDRLGEPFSARALALRYTPRRMAFHLPTGLVAVVEADHNAFGAAERACVAARAAATHPAETALAGLPSAEALAASASVAANARGGAVAATAAAAAAALTLQGGVAGGGGNDDDGDGMEVDGAGGDDVRASVAATLAVAVASAAAADGDGGGGGAGGGSLSDDGVLSDETEGGASDALAEGVDARRVGAPLPDEPGRWASCVRLVDASVLTSGAAPLPGAGATHHVLELADDEAALSVATACFHDQGDDHFVLVGCAQGLTLHPRRARACSVHTYRVVAAPATAPAPVPAPAAAGAGEAQPAPPAPPGRFRLQLVHKTPVEAPPLSLAAFQGRVLVGVGTTLRLYDLGRKRLLRKCEVRGFPTGVQGLQTSLDRVVVSDAQESVHFVKYRHAENALAVFADDTAARHMTSALLLDHDTVMGADKFGSVFVLRLPADVSDDIDGSGVGAGAGAGAGLRALWDSAGQSSGAPNKCVQVASFYVGAAVTSLQKAVLQPGGSEVVLYATVHGAIGALVPLAGKDEADLFVRLERALRGEAAAASLVGRDHVSFRSSFVPVSHVVDGDLCEAFARLPFERQAALAADLDRTPAEVVKKLEDLRNRVC